MNNLYINASSKVDEFMNIPYEERTPEQRWAILCVEIRKLKHWQRSQLGKYFGVVTSTVCYWEAGKTFPKNDIIYKAAELLGRSVDNLVSYLNNSDYEITTQQDSDIYDLAVTLKEDELLTLIKKLIELAIAKQKKA
jgi:transcriptional regulator with XRE-family HTH domain